LPKSCSFASDSSRSWTFPTSASDLIPRIFYLIRCHNVFFWCCGEYALQRHVRCTSQHSHHLHCIETFIRLRNLPTFISSFPLPSSHSEQRAIMSSYRGRPAYVEDYDETTGTVDRDNRQVTSTKKSKRHRESRKPRISSSDAQYPGESSSKDAPAVEEEKPVRVEHRGFFGSDDIWSGDEMFVSSSLPSQVPVSRGSLLFPPSAITQSPEMWDPDFLDSQRSSPTLIEDSWALPPLHMITSTTNSPLDYSPSLDSVSPRYVEDFADLVEPAPYTMTGNGVTRKPIGPRQSKLTSDFRRTRVARSSETSDESSRFIGRSSLELDNTAREHPLYHNVTPKADGLYHCPFEDDPKTNCTHKPEKLKCNYEYAPRLFFCFPPLLILTTLCVLANSWIPT
jgi:hypothetical protein